MARARALDSKTIVFFGTAAVFMLFVCHPIFGPDIWFHLAWGREILDSGNVIPKMPVLFAGPGIANQYWLYQVMMARGYELGGATFITALYASLWMAIIAIWIRLADLWNKPLIGPVAFLAFLYCAKLRLEYRPETLSLLFLGLFILILSRPKIGRSEIALLSLIEVLWTNTHGYFILGPILASMAALAQPRRSNLLLIPVVAIASLANPAGVDIWANAYNVAVVNKHVASQIEEMKPVYSYVWFGSTWISFWSFFAVTLIMAVRSLFRREHIFFALLGLLGLAVGIGAIRFISTFLILTAPMFGVFSSWLEDRLKANRMALGSVHAAIAIVLCFLAFTVSTGRYFHWTDGYAPGIGIEKSLYPIRAVEYLKQIGFSGRIFHDDYDGGYIEYFLPNATVVCDSSYTSPEVVKTYFAAETNLDAFSAMDKQLQFDAILIRTEDLVLFNHLLKSADWVTAHSDAFRVLFLRRDKYSRFEHPLSQGIYYEGDDLRRWGYSVAPALWMGIAYLRSDAALAGTLFQQYSRAASLPSSAVVFALQTALRSNDSAMSNMALTMYKNMFRAGHDENVDQLAAALRSKL